MNEGELLPTDMNPADLPGCWSTKTLQSQKHPMKITTYSKVMTKGLFTKI